MIKSGESKKRLMDRKRICISYWKETGGTAMLNTRCGATIGKRDRGSADALFKPD